MYGEKTKDVPMLILDRNLLGQITFRAIMFKLFHLSAHKGQEYCISLRGLPVIDLECVRMLTWGLLQIKNSEVIVHMTALNQLQWPVFKLAVAVNRHLYVNSKQPLKPNGPIAPSVTFHDLPVCTNFKIRVPRAPPAALLPVSSVLPAPSLDSSAPLPSSRQLDRNARRKLPLPADVKCRSCGFVWKKNSITISQSETYRSQCKLHNRPCVSRVHLNKI